VAELAAKMRREETYHLLHFDAWLRRLAEAGGEARERLLAAVDRLWADAQAVFTPLAGEAALLESGILPAPLSAIRAEWVERVTAAFAALGLPLPDAAAEPSGDGRSRRTDDFGWLHSQFTMVARSEAAATW
jgi:ring-1,2-phenylacetyl-CoA epoxidase subunit PaaC